MPKTPKYFDTKINVRFAPLQLQLIDYCVAANPHDFGNPDGFRDRSDYIRRAITLQAKTMLSPQEFELVCSRAQKRGDADA